jgi:N6-adenosine-specific RNA methylase IME4
MNMDNTGTVIIDPPWPYQAAKKSERLTGYSSYEYPPLSIDELGRLPVRQLGTYIFLWTTGPFIEDAYKLIRHWGFEPITFMAWVKTNKLELGKEIPFKPSYGVGYWFRGCVEPIIVAKAPKAPSIRTPWTGLLCDNARHSRKPDTLYELIETSFPAPWIELFGRRLRDNWAVYGNEIDGRDIREVI